MFFYFLQKAPHHYGEELSVKLGGDLPAALVVFLYVWLESHYLPGLIKRDGDKIGYFLSQISLF